MAKEFKSKSSPVLQIKNLNASYLHDKGETQVLFDVSFDLKNGEVLGLIGSSGSGKSSLLKAILNLEESQFFKLNGQIIFQDNKGGPIDLVHAKSSEMQKIRGDKISIIFQEPYTSLNPNQRCGKQVSEVLLLHGLATHTKQAKEESLRWLNKVGFDHPARIYNAFPHELSGGEQQRVMIAMAMCPQPTILLADEPTSSLDSVSRDRIIDIVSYLQKEQNTSIIWVSHDLSTLNQISDRVLGLESGKLKNSKRNFSTLALNGTRRKDETIDEKIPLIEVRDLSIRYPKQKNLFGKTTYTEAVNNLSFQLQVGEVLGLVGPSGSGKSSIGGAITKLVPISSGVIYFNGENIYALSDKHARIYKEKVQLIFQDSASALSPKKRIGETISEVIVLHQKITSKSEIHSISISLLGRVGLGPNILERWPHELSGGQRQRVCIARALAVEPDLLICDEITSSLDRDTQGEILKTLIDICQKSNLTLLIISHDEEVIRSLCHRKIELKS